MSVITIILIGVGLSIDAFTISITSGITIKQLKINNAMKIAFFFGAFQAIMPLIGWKAGLELKNFLAGIDHWVIFSILVLIGCKMIYESFILKTEKKESNPLNIYVLLILSIATSLDALAVGISFAFLKISLLTAVIIIGGITFSLSFIGVYIGNKIGHFFENKIEIFGGIILICMGIKILIEHIN
ncbi:manganese efflux pump [Candidatus Desantisbacteria bacterium]|nr:manganese efflux pump [Candidatus Desantisbacteria bacterium]